MCCELTRQVAVHVETHHSQPLEVLAALDETRANTVHDHLVDIRKHGEFAFESHRSGGPAPDAQQF